MTAATPARDELREQIAAALRAHRFDRDVNGAGYCRCGGWMGTAVMPWRYHAADVVLPVVDTWVAAHTAEVAALRVDVETYRRAVIRGNDLVAEFRKITATRERIADAERAERDALRTAVARVRALCEQGHPYDEANTYRAPSKPNGRVCRACGRDRAKARTSDPPTEGQ